MKKTNRTICFITALALLGTAVSFARKPELIGENAQVRYAAGDEETLKKEGKEVLDSIDLNIDASHVVFDLKLPFKGAYNAVISWVSSDSQIVSISTSTDDSGKITSINGKVTRPENDTGITLTATATINSVACATRDFALTVLKAKSIAVTPLPLKIDEDFSSYESGMDLSNYYKWQMAKGENLISEIVDKDSFPNINNLVSEKALALSNPKSSSDTYYERAINVTAADTANGAVIEGYMLYSGLTNGLSIELCASGTRVAGFSFGSAGYSYLANSAYVASASVSPTEGVWERFRMVFRPKSGYTIFQVYDWLQAKYIDITAESTLYKENAGVVSGGKGDVNTLRIAARYGAKSGTVYLSDLKIDTTENLPTDTPVNPNRTVGLGTIEGYNSDILAYTGATVSGVDPTLFVVHNRFNSSAALVLDSDYSVTTVSNASADGKTVTYTHTFVLKATKETKLIKQTVYFDDQKNSASLIDFTVGYLKAVKGVTGKATIDMSGFVIRDDSTFYYMVLTAGSAAPTAAQIIDGTTTLTGYAAGGSQKISSRFFSLTTQQLDITSEYDVYALAHNSNGNSDVIKTESISTVINIASAEDLYAMCNDIETKSSVFRMIKDLDLSDYTWVFDPASTLSFEGSFDGQGHTISNLRITSPSTCTAMFYKLQGTFKNVTFDKAYISGLEYTGVVAGGLYASDVSNVRFTDCKVDQEQTVLGSGAGYFGILCGRVRTLSSQSSNNNLTDIYISGAKVSCPKYVGLLTGAVVNGNQGGIATCNITDIYAQGTVDTEGAAVGLIGRNLGTTNVKNALVYLDIANAKKEVGLIAGHNKTGGILHAENVIGDLKIEMMTQVNYFNNFIGSNDEANKYDATNAYFVYEDYSNLSDSIVPDSKAIGLGTLLDLPAVPTKEYWETKTFIRDFDTSLIWAFDETTHMPTMISRTKAQISFTADEFNQMVAGIDTAKILASHYAIYKAEDMLEFMTAEEKAKISTDTMNKLTEAKAAYETASSDVSSVGDGLDSIKTGSAGNK
jgi:hypothetical protein